MGGSSSACTQLPDTFCTILWLCLKEEPAQRPSWKPSADFKHGLLSKNIIGGNL